MAILRSFPRTYSLLESAPKEALAFLRLSPAKVLRAAFKCTASKKRILHRRDPRFQVNVLHSVILLFCGDD
ncbi:hypothetical protein RND71_008530 [Anisodus tanguticus]|uniref:Uncharacterized protein n=1 Tax=Anisodus tanguticus TaxID=243964 RepID=A0AAE1SR24_9SOLA|nr:hypothetical protein RND71_008530 [Anisodus tanguticus]